MEEDRERWREREREQEREEARESVCVRERDPETVVGRERRAGRERGER